MKLLHVTMDYDDPVTQALMQESSIDLITISIEEFINSVSVLDRCSRDKTEICWQLNKQLIVNDRDTLLLSRVCHFPLTLMKPYISEDREYALAELEAYFGFAFNAFNSLHNDIDESGCLECYSLPSQWSKLRCYNFPITTPEYFLGDMRFNHLQGDNLIYSDIYQYNLWSKQKINGITTETTFCFTEPKGKAVICLVIDQNVLLTESTNNITLIESEIAEIKSIAKKLAGIFRYFICEILLFYNDGKITFGCISPYIVQSNENEQFNSMVNQSITAVVKKYEKNIHA